MTIPYVAYQDVANGSRATVQKFSAGAWSVVGTAGFSVGSANYTQSAGDPNWKHKDVSLKTRRSTREMPEREVVNFNFIKEF